MIREQKIYSLKGFTLLELGIVIFIISLMATIAVPYLYPLFTTSQLEAEARKLANFGRVVMATSAIMGDEFYVEIDLDRQRYFCLRLTYPRNVEGEVDLLAKLEELLSSGVTPEEVTNLLASGLNQGTQSNMSNSSQNQGFDTQSLSQQVNDMFENVMRKKLMDQAKNVKHKDSLLDEVGSLFDEDDVNLFGVEPVVEEVNDPGLSPVSIPEEVWIESVFVGGKKFSRGLVEISVSSLGLTEVVSFYLRNSEGEYYTVVWDPSTGGAYILEGAV
ncbi:MAG: prepilin-type N-terminal cleavage/methylation domain-containing protein [Candidatus Hydrogenedentes bacterium]|nr:prepilin-type N-terminal cleavage/methylation domain-containing protein [Candidatus Hydrogenedentota bacterium]